jgi:hypothetical protein
MPLLDADLVEFLYRLPARLLVDGGRAKALAREVVARRLPSFGGNWPRTVSGYAYYRRLIEQEASLAWREAEGIHRLGDLGVVDEQVVTRLAREGSSSPDIRWLWPVTNLDVWLRSRTGAKGSARSMAAALL